MGAVPHQFGHHISAHAGPRNNVPITVTLTHAQRGSKTTAEVVADGLFVWVFLFLFHC